MLNVDNWVMGRSEYWWDRLNKSHHTLYEIPAISITDRLSRMAGICKVKSGKVEVVLYEYYINSEGEKYDQTIGHEFAHAHNYFHFHEISHGQSWQQAMLKIGLEPIRCHQYKAPNTHDVNCHCGRVISFGRTQIKRLYNNPHANYFCRHCKRKIRYIDNAIHVGY